MFSFRIIHKVHSINPSWLVSDIFINCFLSLFSFVTYYIFACKFLTNFSSYLFYQLFSLNNISLHLVATILYNFISLILSQFSLSIYSRFANYIFSVIFSSLFLSFLVLHSFTSFSSYFLSTFLSLISLYFLYFLPLLSFFNFSPLLNYTLSLFPITIFKIYSLSQLILCLSTFASVDPILQSPFAWMHTDDPYNRLLKGIII